MDKKRKQEIVRKRCPECDNILEKKEVSKPPGWGSHGTETVLKCPNCGYKKEDPFRSSSFFHSER